MLKHIKPGTLIYKFLDRQSEYFWPAVLDILTRHQIYLNSRNNFNDPYDSRPIVEGQISLSDAQKYVDLMFANPRTIHREPETIAEIERLKGLGKTRLSEQQVLNISQGMRAKVDEFIDKCGISCFSLEAKESLLWAHYAGGFSGICIAFKRSASKSSAFSVCAEVVYVDERPRMSIDLFYRMVLARQTGQELCAEVGDGMKG